MSNPALEDPYWIAAAEFVCRNALSGDSVAAPVEFQVRLPDAVPISRCGLGDLERLAWLVIHKGQLQALDLDLLQAVSLQWVPAFANEVFVVYTARRDLRPVTGDHLRALTLKLEELLTAQKAPAARPAFQERGGLLAIEEIAHLPRAELEAACRQAAQFAYLGDRTGLCRVLTRYLFLVDTSDLTVGPHLALNGFWEPWITQAIARELRPGLACLDIGANLGYFSVLMADAVGSSGRVLAVEPNPRLTELLNGTLELNGLQGWTSVKQAAVIDESGRDLEFAIPGNRLGHATLYGDRNRHRILRVESTTIDELTSDWQRVDLVKIDVEGAEERVWKGMSQTLRRNPQITVIMEFSARRHYDPGAFLKRIQDDGFPLAYVGYDSSVRRFSVDDCLTQRPYEWMLFLRRR